MRLVPLPTLGIVGGVGMEVDGDGIGNWRRDPFPTTIIPCPPTRSQLNNTCCNSSRVDEDALGVGAPYHKEEGTLSFFYTTPPYTQQHRRGWPPVRAQALHLPLAPCMDVGW